MCSSSLELEVCSSSLELEVCSSSLELGVVFKLVGARGVFKLVGARVGEDDCSKDAIEDVFAEGAADEDVTDEGAPSTVTMSARTLRWMRIVDDGNDFGEECVNKLSSKTMLSRRCRWGRRRRGRLTSCRRRRCCQDVVDGDRGGGQRGVLS